MSGDVHVRTCEGLGVKFPRATRLADLESLPFLSKSNRIVCLTNPAYFEKIEPIKPPRADVGVVANWIEEDWGVRILTSFWYLQMGNKGFFESIHYNDSDQAFR
jgi:hypothetical protein